MVPSCPMPKDHEYFTSCAMIIPFIVVFGRLSQLTLMEVVVMVMAITLLGTALGTEKDLDHCTLMAYFKLIHNWEEST